MHRLHLHPSHISGGRSASPLIFSRTVNANGQISPPLSDRDYGSIGPSPIPSDSPFINSSLDIGRLHHQSVSELLQTAPVAYFCLQRSSSNESRRTSLSAGSSRASSLWLQRPLAHHALSTNDPEQEIKDLCQLNLNLEEKYKILEAQHETLRDAYDALLHALRQSGTLKDQENKQDEPLRREDYPGVRFWTRRDWLDRSGQESDTMVLDNSGRRGKARASQGINVAMRYVEDENGTVVDGHRATEMRRYARLIWVHQSNNGGLPPSWGKADVKLSQAYCHEMRQRFPELALCDLDWKADQIATDNYPSWFKNWSESSQKSLVKQEQGDRSTKQEQEDRSPAINPKRLNMPTSDEPVAKKLKVTADLDPSNMEVTTNSFQIKNLLTTVDASKLTSLATNFISTTVPQDPASSLPPTAHLPSLNIGATNFISTSVPQDPASSLPPTAHLPSLNIGLNSDVNQFDRSSRNVASSPLAGNPITVDFQAGSHEDRDTAMTCVATSADSDILIPNVTAESGANSPGDAGVDITDFPSGLNLVTSDTTATSTTMTMAVDPSKMTSVTDASVNSVTTVPPAITAVPSWISMSSAAIPTPIIPMGIAVPSGMSPTTTLATGTVTNIMPISTMDVPSGMTSTKSNASATFNFSAMTMPGTSASAPMSMVVPSTNVSAAITGITSSTIPCHGASGIGNIAAGALVTKKKLTTKKRITNSNTAKNLCARDWVPAVGGSTEEFDRHWDSLKEEEKNKYIERSKQLRLAALNC